jgi:hypothetical protein
MSDAIFPSYDGLDIAVKREQLYDTRTQRESGGRELTISSRSQARYSWTLKINRLTQTEADALSAFHAGRRGRWDTFLFSDPLMPTATLWTFRDGIGTGTLRAVGNGALTDFYMCDPNADPIAERGLDLGVLSNLSVRVNGVTKTFTSDYTLNTTNGALRIHFVAAPGGGLSIDWSGPYLRRCRFDEDGLKITRIVSGIYSATVNLTSQVLP